MNIDRLEDCLRQIHSAHCFSDDHRKAVGHAVDFVAHFRNENNLPWSFNAADLYREAVNQGNIKHELLKALERWHQFMLDNYMPDDISWWNETVAAIAKAKGE